MWALQTVFLTLWESVSGVSNAPLFIGVVGLSLRLMVAEIFDSHAQKVKPSLGAPNILQARFDLPNAIARHSCVSRSDGGSPIIALHGETGPSALTN